MGWGDPRLHTIWRCTSDPWEILVWPSPDFKRSLGNEQIWAFVWLISNVHESLVQGKPAIRLWIAPNYVHSITALRLVVRRHSVGFRTNFSQGCIQEEHPGVCKFAIATGGWIVPLIVKHFVGKRLCTGKDAYRNSHATLGSRRQSSN